MGGAVLAEPPSPYFPGTSSAWVQCWRGPLTTKATFPGLGPGLSAKTPVDTGVHYLEDRAQEGVLLVPAELDEDQEGQHAQRLLPCAPQDHHPLWRADVSACPHVTGLCHLRAQQVRRVQKWGVYTPIVPGGGGARTLRSMRLCLGKVRK